MQTNQPIRVRFAPSPTGLMHIGSLRTALYDYLFAKKNHGVFILRIEDTDRNRYVEGAVENIVKTLAWAGIPHDEGVFCDEQGSIFERGNYGPYQQSKKFALYQEYAKKLIEKGSAYYCFCSEDRLKELRKAQEKQKLPTRYDRKCRDLSVSNVEEKLKNKEPFVVRLKIPMDGETIFSDAIRGKISVQNKEIDDQILLKNDGFPTYHLANVVDDRDMKITHVIRGEEWLPSTPKHVLLYEAFGWEPPVFAHLPLLLNPDKSKLSKRQGDVSVEDYIQKGYLKEAIINFVALLGWNPRGDREIYSLDELAENFFLEKVNKSGAVFSLEKLNWLNSHYLKTLDPESTGLNAAIRHGYETFAAEYPIAKLLISSQKAFETIRELFRERITRFDEIPQFIEEHLYLISQPQVDPNLLIWKKSDKQNTRENLIRLKEFLSTLSQENWNKEKLETSVKKYIADEKLTNGEVLWPFRVALTGAEKSPDPFTIASLLEIIKPGEVGERLQLAIEKLK